MTTLNDIRFSLKKTEDALYRSLILIDEELQLETMEEILKVLKRHPCLPDNIQTTLHDINGMLSRKDFEPAKSKIKLLIGEWNERR
jgi:hypothetical protein